MPDKKADFSERLLRHQTQLFGYIYSLVRDFDDADDLFQQTSLALWKKFDQYDPARSFSAWAFGVARFEVSNFLRSRSRDRLYFTDELNLWDPDRAHPPQARGFTVLSPRGRVVDLGTEFGLSVDDAGATTVRVFTGVVVAFPLLSAVDARPSVTLNQNQSITIDGRTVALRLADSQESSVRFVRSIEPSPVVTPRTFHLDFTRASAGSILDAEGHGIGLTHRLPGTGAALPRRDPNLRLQTGSGALSLTTTRSDINTQDRMSTGEYLGVRLSDLGFTGREDFEFSATIPKIPSLDVVGQFGLYVGASSVANIRGGLISTPQLGRYGLFLVNNLGGRDSDLNEVGVMSTGDDLRLTMRRANGRYCLVVENITRGSSNTLAINHPSFLDKELDLFAGLFGANTQSDVCKTLTVSDVKITVWTTQPSTSGSKL